MDVATNAHWTAIICVSAVAMTIVLKAVLTSVETLVPELA